MESKRVLKREGLNLVVDKETLDDQRILEVGTEVPDKAKVDDKEEFENYKVLYKGAIDDKCIELYGSCDDEKLWEDTAKELYLSSKNYIPEADKKADGELVDEKEPVKESRRVIKHNKITEAIELTDRDKEILRQKAYDMFKTSKKFKNDEKGLNDYLDKEVMPLWYEAQSNLGQHVTESKKLNESIEVHEELNPKIWNSDNTMKDDVYQKLLEISNEFIKYIEIPLNIVDIEVVGSNASYNYNENSDIDLHIIVNSEVNYVDPEILRMLYNSKKNSFNDNYDLSIDDIPIELYIEDVKDGNATNGRYSISKNEWVVFPKPITYEIPDISETLNEYETKCNEALTGNDAQAILDLVNDIYMMRKLGLADEGEASVGNLVFKELRNQDMITKLKDHYYDLRSNELSE